MYNQARPGRLPVKECLMQNLIAQALGEHTEAIIFFEEAIGVKGAIIQQKVVAIELIFSLHIELSVQLIYQSLYLA